MFRNSPKNKCQCGSLRFENVDITPVNTPEKKRYFIRCRKCGLVVRSYQSSKIPAVLQAVKLVCEMVKSKKSI